MAVFSIVLPAYNEEEAIEQTLDRAVEAASKLEQEPQIERVEILVVDDGSTDRTAALAGQFEGVRVVSHGTNRGYGAALKTGFAEAHGDLLAFHDADATIDSNLLVPLVRKLFAEEADIVLGSRVGRESKMPRVRRVGNRFYAMLLSILSGNRVTDTASGIRVFWRHTIDRLYPLPDSLDFTPVMSAKALFEHMKLIEMPIPYEERRGESKLSVVGDGVRFLLSILDIVMIYNPLKLFLPIAVLFFLIAVFFGAFPVYHYALTRIIEEWMIYRLLTVSFCMSAGLFVYLQAVLMAHMLEQYTGNLPRLGPIARLFYNRVLFALFLPLGLLLVLCGLLLLGPSFVEYMTETKVTSHWAYFVLSMMLILNGIQLVGLKLLLGLVRMFWPMRVSGRLLSPMSHEAQT